VRRGETGLVLGRSRQKYETKLRPPRSVEGINRSFNGGVGFGLRVWWIPVASVGGGYVVETRGGLFDNRTGS